MGSVKLLIETTLGIDINDLFTVVVTSEVDKKKKPSSEVYEIALYELNIHPDRCIAIEDSLNDLISAKSVGLRTVITPSFYKRDENFSKANLVLTSLTAFKI